MICRVRCNLVHDVTKHNILMLSERLWIRLDKFGACSPMNAVGHHTNVSDGIFSFLWLMFNENTTCGFK